MSSFFKNIAKGSSHTEQNGQCAGNLRDRSGKNAGAAGAATGPFAGLSLLEQNMLGPDYKYYKHIRTPAELGVTSAGNLDAMGKNIGGIVNYVQLLVEGGGRASTTGGPLGSKFYVKTAGKCKDIVSEKIVPRYIYLNNVPSGNIPLISSGLGVNFSEFKGLLPGIVEDMGALNPMDLFASFMQGATPACKEVTFPVMGDNRVGAPKSGHVAVSEINDYLKIQNRKEAFISGNKLLRGEKLDKNTKNKLTPFANMYVTGFGVLLLYLMCRMTYRKR